MVNVKDRLIQIKESLLKNPKTFFTGSMMIASGGVGLIAYGTFLAASLITLLFGLGASINVIMYEMTGNFFVSHLWFVGWYASISVPFFYLAISLASLRIVVTKPPKIALVIVPVTVVLLYFFVTGTVGLVETHVSASSTTAVFTEDLLVGLVYSGVGASASLKSFSDEDEDTEEDDDMEDDDN